MKFSCIKSTGKTKVAVFLFIVLFFVGCDLRSSLEETDPDYDAPTIPQGLTEISSLSYRVTLSWDPSTDNVRVSGYRLYRDGSPLGTSRSTSYADTTVEGGSTYSYTVSAYDAAGNESGQSEGLPVYTPESSPEPTIVDHRNTDPASIPDEFIDAAKENLHIAYQHTSHGSQIMSGMVTMAAYAPYGLKYQHSEDGSAGLDIDSDDPIMSGYHDLSTEDLDTGSGNTPWANATRTFLNNTDNYHINVVMWSWCSINGHDIDRYITNMERLIAEYGVGGTNARAAEHPVEFVFMTGHSDGGGVDGSVAMAAEQIRTHCIDNNRWLIDYYDLESYDPEDTYYGDDNITDNLNYDGGNWAVNYLASHDESTLDILTMGDGGSFSGCTSCAHSDSPRAATLNCVLKAQAAWWLFARISGW